MNLMFKLNPIKAGLISAALGLSLAPAAHAGCLSHVPDACTSDIYNPDAFLSHWRPMFYSRLQQESFAINPEDDNPNLTCLLACEIDYRQMSSNCLALPNDDPQIGDSARNICIEVAERRYRDCILVDYLRCE